ncbi:hypothetical protein [Peribacillus frigoritolerans]|uniref:hypothetical protein n=1 Tax=Peribacillus frigoritolerans TaxID=450367 RepID=UPI0032E4727D
MYEANSIVKFMGWCLVIMGILYCTSYLYLNEWQITCYSLSAFAFVLLEVVDFVSEPYDNKLTHPLSDAPIIRRLNKAKQITYFIAISFITWLPFIHKPLSNVSSPTLPNTVLLIGLGVTIILIGYRMDKRVARDFNLWWALKEKRDSEWEEMKEAFLNRENDEELNSRFPEQLIGIDKQDDEKEST